ncbi:nuclear transport factor 2 family protein [Flavilitoribacter nigricans]|uniref:Limonene-1,2-epoxide hydrolase n=1 Tax=Flavilitoribacter nigricans (strain ATCC 23147 / DSM 23189 / NBRC 102662 / NCIMB 1420 / SS-2) TaxID=1122177 RepID=A0A2D0MXG3_FLAN2|nr:nuclear transport factor 2 family protein [Flavilitoribacter nigricans]PHN00860.1 limonene-1,2-epoxide hydrolase [Flavilitoribacter nigricans DSM 23189 = NBRC 102662]
MSEHPNHQLLEKLYQSFQNGDAAGMRACYHPEATFEDPAFGKLKGDEVGQMWTMLLERSAGQLDITYSQIQADDHTGSAYWEAKYLFSKTKRPVHNKINSRFRFQDGLIIDQKDTFSMWRWSSMALGATGKLLGFTAFLKRKVQRQSRTLLWKYMGR